MVMAHTPRRTVHWALEGSPFGSPFSEGTSNESFSSGSSVQFINDQLIAHGFTHAPGLCLESLSNADAEKVVKCLLAMLSQRIEDMARTEDLTTKLRTLSYDHERLKSMHADAKERAANAERDVETYKSRLAAVNRALQSSEAAHKQTTGELQRTRSTLQTVRATHHAEIKKKEKEMERTIEKWAKLSDSQLKLGSIASSMTMRCANGTVTGAGIMGKGKGFLEVALEHAEKAAKELREENFKLRQMVLGTVNELQSVVHLAKTMVSENDEEPAPLTMTALFPLSPTGAASGKLNSLLGALKDSLSLLARSSISAPASSTSSTQTKVAPDGEVEKLQGIIDGLKAELEQARMQSAEHTAKIQEMFDRYAEDERINGSMNADVSCELMTAPLRDEEKERLEDRARELEEERKKFTEATIRLGKERAALEAEKLKLQEEMRSWQVEKMLSELPPTPASSMPAAAVKKRPSPDIVLEKENIPIQTKSPRKGLSKSLTKSQRHSPVKAAMSIAVGKGASAKRVRVSRRSSLGTSPTKLVPAFETELLPPLPAPTFKTSLTPPRTSEPLLLPSSFVLPPPSPASILPPPDSLLAPPSSIPPVSTSIPSEIPHSEHSPLTLEALQAPPDPVASSFQPNDVPAASESRNPIFPPATPARRPFPVAKPFANRMSHAYSPAKPSPLSRILMLADSPSDPALSPPTLEALAEEAEVEELETQVAPVRAEPALTLAQELGVEEDDDSPLREKAVVPNLRTRAAKGKGKEKAGAAASGRTRQAPGALDKENNDKRVKGRAGLPASLTTSKAAPTVKAVQSTSKPPAAPGPKLTLKQGISRGGGPRRVPVGSAEAAPIGPGWKG